MGRVELVPLEKVRISDARAKARFFSDLFCFCARDRYAITGGASRKEFTSAGVTFLGPGALGCSLRTGTRWSPDHPRAPVSKANVGCPSFTLRPRPMCHGDRDDLALQFVETRYPEIHNNSATAWAV